MKILDHEADGPATSHGDAIEIYSDGGRPLFRLRLTGETLDIAAAGDGGAIPATLAVAPLSATRLSVRRDRREHGDAL